MFNKILPKSKYARNVLTLMTGTGLAQAIPIAISPILTRLYTPEEFGIFGLYLAIVAILAVAATGRYEMAILLPKNDKDAMNIVFLSATLSFLFSLALLFIVIFFNEHIAAMLGEPAISAWLYWVPISVLLVGLYQSLNYWSNRKAHYKRLAISRTFQSGASSSTQVGAGYLNVGAMGLIGGQVAGQVVSSAVLAQQIISEDKKQLRQISKKRMLLLARKYKNFPKFLILAHGFNTGSAQMPIILLTAFFSSSIAGLYMLTQRVMGAPTTLIAGAIGDVFRQEASQAYIHTGSCRAIYISTFKKLLVLSLVPSILFFFIAPDLFALVFGEQWREAGVYAQILTPVFFLRFVTSPLSSVCVIVEKQWVDLIWQIILFAFTFFSILLGYFSQNIIYGLYAYSLSYSIMFIVAGIINYNFSSGSFE